MPGQEQAQTNPAKDGAGDEQREQGAKAPVGWGRWGVTRLLGGLLGGAAGAAALGPCMLIPGLNIAACATVAAVAGGATCGATTQIAENRVSEYIRLPFNPRELEKAAIKGIAPHVSDVVCDHIHGLAESAIHNMGVTAEDSFEETRRVDSAAHLEPYFALLKASDTLRMTLVVTWTPARGKAAAASSTAAVPAHGEYVLPNEVKWYENVAESAVLGAVFGGLAGIVGGVIAYPLHIFVHGPYSSIGLELGRPTAASVLGLLSKDAATLDPVADAGDAHEWKLIAHIKYCVSLLQQAACRNNQRLAYSFKVERSSKFTVGRSGDKSPQASSEKSLIFEIKAGP